MKSIVMLQLWQFSLVYLLLLVVLAVMKYCGASQSRLLLWASFRMTVQLVLAGLVLTYIFGNPRPVFTAAYLLAMTGFAIHRVLSQNRMLSKPFRRAIAGSLAVSGLCVLAFFLCVVVGVSLFDPQYAIPLGGMVIGNAMTGTSLGTRAFRENVLRQRGCIEALLNLGVHPRDILRPFVNEAMETALLPTLNSMLGMGIVSLPGMMTGQLLSGTLPTTAILYQIAIMVSICTVVCLSVFGALYLGHRTLYNERCQILLWQE